ncbi:MAG: acyl-CoA thioesterase [Desulfobacterales bacterium]|nr:MAG: acyl-CoA thioesterase [Desulfobacterales bacterium]
MKTTVKIKIRGYHIDHFQHVNNARYLEFLEEGRWHYSEKNNLISIFHQKGISHVTVNININYKRSAVVGEVLRIETSVIRKNRKSVTMLQQVFLNDTDILIADAQVTNVFLHIKSGNVMRINEELNSLLPDIAKTNQITR